jgi:hypothetical protein
MHPMDKKTGSGSKEEQIMGGVAKCYPKGTACLFKSVMRKTVLE